MLICIIANRAVALCATECSRFDAAVAKGAGSDPCVNMELAFCKASRDAEERELRAQKQAADAARSAELQQLRAQEARNARENLALFRQGKERKVAPMLLFASFHACCA